VRYKAQAPLPLKTPPKPVDLSIVKKAQELGISEDKTEELLTRYGDDNVRQGLAGLETRMASAYPAPIRDAHRYLKASLSGVAQKEAESQTRAESTAHEVLADSSKKQNELKAAWRDEWIKRQKAKVISLINELSPESIAELELNLCRALEAKDPHPSVIKRLQSNGWDHPLVRHFMIDFYAKAAIGDDWDKPSTEDLLDIASGSGA